MSYVVLYINCTRGKFRAEGLFDDEVAALAWIDQQDDPRAYSAFPLLRDSRSEAAALQVVDLDVTEQEDLLRVVEKAREAGGYLRVAIMVKPNSATPLSPAS